MSNEETEAYGVAALGVAVGILFKMVEAGIMSRDEATRLFEAIETNRRNVARETGSNVEHKAALIAAELKREFAARAH